MRVVELLRYAWSDLSHRRTTTLLNVGAVCLACVYILVLGFYGASIHGYQSDLLARSMQTRIVVVAPDATDERLLFTPERMDGLAAQEGVVGVFPRLEINVQVMLDPVHVESTRAVGTAVGDPSLAAGRLAWGRGLERVGGREVVLPARFFEKLGGRLHAERGPAPARLVLEVGRTTATGVEQRESLELDIVGLLEHQEEERVHVPVELVRELQLYCGSYKATLFGADERTLRYADLSAWVARGDERLVEAELRLQQVEARAEEHVSVSDDGSVVWASLGSGSGDIADAPAWLAASGVATSVRQSVVSRLGDVDVLVLAADDHRWDAHDPARLLVVTDAGRAFALARGVAGRDLDSTALTGECDLVADEAGWRRLAFEPELSDGVQPFCWVTASDLVTCAALAGVRGAAPDAPPLSGFAFVRAPAAIADPVRDRDADPARTPSSAAIDEAERLLDDLAVARGPFASLDPAPAALGDIDDAGDGADVLVEPRTVVDGPVTGPEGARTTRRVPAAFLSSDLPLDAIDVACVPDDGSSIDPEAEGLVLWGAWDALLVGVARLSAAGWDVEDACSHVPESVSVVLAGEREEVVRRLGEDVTSACRVDPFLGVRARSAALPNEPLYLARGSAFGELRPGTVQMRARGVAALAVEGAGWTLPSREVDGFADIPPSLVLVGDDDFRAAAWGSSSRDRAVSGEPRTDVCLRDVLAFETATAAASDDGLALVAFDEPARTTLVRYRVTDPLSADGRLDGTLVRQLAMAAPPFRDCLPSLALPVRLDGMRDELTLVGSSPADPARHAHVPVTGTWLLDDVGPNQVVLPRRVLDIAPGRRGHDLLGRAVTVVARRQLAGGPSEELRLPLRLVGLVDGETGFVPLALLEDLTLWTEDRVVYNDAAAAFVSPAQIVAGRGDTSCNLYVDDVEHVAQVVSMLRARGYETHDRLEEQRALQRLGRVLGFLVVFFALGCAANAAITVCVATMMNVKSKIYEIGILRAHGLRRGQVLWIFASQGACIGLIAFALAVVVVLLFEPLVRDGVLGMFSLERGSILQGSPFDGRWWWVSASAFAAAVSFSVIGVLAPAWRACRLSPVDALKSRE